MRIKNILLIITTITIVSCNCARDSEVYKLLQDVKSYIDEKPEKFQEIRTRISSVNAFASRGLDLSVQIGFLRTSGWIRTIHAFYMHIAGNQNNFVYIYSVYKTKTMNNPKSHKVWRIAWPIIALGWLVLSILEFIDDERNIVRGIILLTFAILWTASYIYELRNNKKEE